MHGATEELGELSHAFLKHKQKIRGYTNEAAYQAEAEDAVGDLIIYLADFCARNGLDLGRAVSETWAKVKQRNWQANPTTGKVAVVGNRNQYVTSLNLEKL